MLDGGPERFLGYAAGVRRVTDAEKGLSSEVLGPKLHSELLHHSLLRVVFLSLLATLDFIDLLQGHFLDPDAG